MRFWRSWEKSLVKFAMNVWLDGSEALASRQIHYAEAASIVRRVNRSPLAPR